MVQGRKEIEEGSTSPFDVIPSYSGSKYSRKAAYPLCFVASRRFASAQRAAAWRRGAGKGGRPAVPTVPAAPARCLTKIGFLFSLVIFGRQSNLTLSCAFVTRCLSTLIVLVFANQINRMAFCRRRRFQSYYFFSVRHFFSHNCTKAEAGEQTAPAIERLECSFPSTRSVKQDEDEGDPFSGRSVIFSF